MWEFSEGRFQSRETRDFAKEFSPWNIRFQKDFLPNQPRTTENSFNKQAFPRRDFAANPFPNRVTTKWPLELSENYQEKNTYCRALGLAPRAA
jgi:hypothetical protein